ncbi:MAG: hypothetical protein WA667_21870 [Candidatus Nitrosopolaris sp.]
MTVFQSGDVNKLTIPFSHTAVKNTFACGLIASNLAVNAALKKNWTGYRIARSNNDGERIEKLQNRINSIQEVPGIDMTEWYM